MPRPATAERVACLTGLDELVACLTGLCRRPQPLVLNRQNCRKLGLARTDARAQWTWQVELRLARLAQNNIEGIMHAIDREQNEEQA